MSLTPVLPLPLNSSSPNPKPPPVTTTNTFSPTEVYKRPEKHLGSATMISAVTGHQVYSLEQSLDARTFR